MSKRRRKSTRSQEAAIVALLAEPTHTAAARAAGISLATLQRWLSMPAFLAAYRAARRQVVEQAVAQSQRAAGEAIETLRANLTAQRPADQIRAARAVIDYALRGLEVTDLVERVAELERVVAERPEADREPDDLDHQSESSRNGAGPRDADARQQPPPRPPGDAAARPDPVVPDGGTDAGPVAGRRIVRLENDPPHVKLPDYWGGQSPDPLF
jgi:hypothetical protein